MSRRFPASPFGSLPVLYVNDEILATDYAICMYIARVHGEWNYHHLRGVVFSTKRLPLAPSR